MKKLVQFSFAVLAVTLILSACSPSKNTITGASNVSRGKFTGSWSLNNVSYEGIVQQAVQNVFDQAPPQDFVGSTWKLTNSGNGSYTLQNGTSQTIFWSVNNNSGSNQLFQFKKLYQGDKAQKITEGYQLVVAANNGNTMTLKSPIAVGDKTAYIIYSFTKAQ
jgi:predicted small secreted protein